MPEHSSPAQPTSNAVPKTQVEDFAQTSSNSQQMRLPSYRNSPESPTTASINTSSSPLGALNAARRPGLPQSSLSSARSGALPQDMQAKMKAFHLSRQGAPPLQNLRKPTNPCEHSSASTQNLTIPGPTSSEVSSVTTLQSPVGVLAGGVSSLRLPPGGRPSAANFHSAPTVPNINTKPKMGLAAKRGLNRGMKLSEASGSPISVNDSITAHGDNPELQKNSINRDSPASAGGTGESMFTKYAEFVDTKTGTLKFKGKATIHGKGIEFSSGSSFSISLDEVDNLEELGKGNYGTVYRVRHNRPRIRRPGFGLNSIKHSGATLTAAEEPIETGVPMGSIGSVTTTDTPTGVVMAMKEIRLELDEAKFAAIIMELDILHRCISPFIVDFYGAFFQEGAVYICMEYMDGGSIDKLYNDGVPEGVLRKITMSTVMGLKSLKDEHNIIHRDVKPTNILVNSMGQVKICDFGVSGNLVASIAKTNIGCQSYMAPERIASGGIAQAGANPGGGTYSVQSDIWSLGLSVIECALGQYPYPPETYNNIFSQLSVNVSSDHIHN